MDDYRQIAVSLSSSSGYDFDVATEVVQGQLVTSIRPTGLDRGRSFSIVPFAQLRTVKAAVELDEFARPLLEAIYEHFDRSRDEIVAQCSEIQGNSSCVFYIAGLRHKDMSTLPNDIWSDFAFEVNQEIEASISHHQALEAVSVKALAILLSLLPLEPAKPTGIDREVGYPEGAAMAIMVNRYERDPRNRAAAIAIHGCACNICGFDFEKSYGDAGMGYIEVHHLVPLSLLPSNYLIDPKNDLIPLCSNCHSLVHRRTPPFSPEEVRGMITHLVDES